MEERIRAYREAFDRRHAEMEQRREEARQRHEEMRQQSAQRYEAMREAPRPGMVPPPPAAPVDERMKAYQEWLRELRSQATIEMDWSLLK